MTYELMVAIILAVLFLWIGYSFFSYLSGLERDKAYRLETQKRAATLSVGQTYVLSVEPENTSIRLTGIDLENRRVSGVIVITLPAGSVTKSVVPLDGWYKFSVEYEKDGVWLFPTWDFLSENALLRDFWEIDPEKPEVKVSSITN